MYDAAPGMIATHDVAHDSAAPQPAPVIEARGVPELRASLVDWLGFIVTNAKPPPPP